MWSDAARQASIEARRANAAAKARQNTATNRAKQVNADNLEKKYPQGQGKPGPQTAAHPNAGNRVAFGVRNKMIHDAGKDQRIATHNRQVAMAAAGGFGGSVLKALAGIALGAGGTIVGDALKGQRGGGRR